MELVNETGMEAGWTTGFERDGRELIVVVVKATYSIPEKGQTPILLDEQVPLFEADEFTGEPGYSATLYETDYSHRKPHCDVLLHGSAYSLDGRPVKNIRVGLHIGTINKRFNVVGSRFWERVSGFLMVTPPEKFTQMKITYDCAYGGTDFDVDKPDKIKTYLHNPIGVGYYPLTRSKDRIGKPLPNTEEPEKHATKTTGKYRPMSFGPISRNFSHRLPFVGTYDQKWLEAKAPFWPDDFDYRYFQCAPPDQQIPYPKGGETVILENLTPNGLTSFKLPEVCINFHFIHHRHDDIKLDGALDTIFIEPDEKRFTLSWRVSLPLRQNCFEISKIIVGKRVKVQNRRGIDGQKVYYKNLPDMIEDKERV